MCRIYTLMARWVSRRRRPGPTKVGWALPTDNGLDHIARQRLAAIGQKPAQFATGSQGNFRPLSCFLRPPSFSEWFGTDRQAILNVIPNQEEF